MISNLKPVIVCAHFDDEVIGCSSLLQYNPTIIVCCNGMNNQDTRLRKESSRLITKKYNVKYIELKLTSGTLKDLGQFYFNNLISNHLNKENFNAIFTHNSRDRHIDHRIVSSAVDVYARSNRTNIDLLAHFYIETEFRENLAIKIDRSVKNSLLDLYSMINNKNLVMDFNNYIGSKYNLDFAEPFKIIYQKIV